MPKYKFNTQIERELVKSKVNAEPVELHPTDSPNVVYIVMDDMGFAQLGCYGSNIHTPNIDRLAQNGIRYNNFHTTAICSATRCSLLTGANHHTAGVGSLVECINGTANGLGHISNEYATIAEILKEYDYAAYAVGKWHLSNNQTPSGPYDQWPIGRGFDRYYGFLCPDMDQFHPFLIQDNTEVPQPKTVEEGYHFSEDVADHAIDYVFKHHMVFPDQPFFLYVAFGAQHAPHHAPKEYIDRYKGKFDAGWDYFRQQWFENQKKLGVIPQNAELTDRNAFVSAWDELTDKEKKLYARYMEAYAGMLEYTDEQIGRIIDYLEKSGQLDNTIIVFLSDNGASGEGGRQGRYNTDYNFNVTENDQQEIDFAYEHIDEIGGPNCRNHYPTGWANAGNTPFQWYKMWTHEGGVKDPLIISYPKGMKETGKVSFQYHHVTDITPTILDVIGVEKPKEIKGIPQKPFTGISMKYTFDNVNEPSHKYVQYYEIYGNRAIYKNGWKAVTNHAFNESYDEDVWELYHVDEDYSEKHNVADKYPEKLQELKEEFFIEAGRNDVFPMVNRSVHKDFYSHYQMFGNYRNIPERDVDFDYIIKPFDFTSGQGGLNLDLGDHILTATVTRTDKNREGVIFAKGDQTGGFVLYIKDNKLKYAYNVNTYRYYVAESDIEIPLGQSTVGYSFTNGEGFTATVVIFINGEKVGEVFIPEFYFIAGPITSVKQNKYTPVYPDYEVPFEFNGELNHIHIHQNEGVYDFAREIEKALARD